MKQANLLNIFEKGASGKVVLIAKTGAERIGDGKYTSFKPSLIGMTGELDWDGKTRIKDFGPIKGTWDYELDILDEKYCHLIFKIQPDKGGGYSIDGRYPYEMRGSRKIIIHSIRTEIFGKVVTGDLTVADAHDHATKYNPDFPVEFGDMGVVTRPIEFD